ncbi:hypothetical protein PPYR_14517 [Photinus pyralis]|uniref:Uncharacterized protein n=1 Tax=Photinus pyralis TaxID=7054 RepID=A0A1Y1M749_PHOPY|nr:uncharacterized protein LOC116180888 [Photinus pyralis]KAB0792558.1 hypothetical protein PPYR_14517 [Photinus pyralis]
MSVAEKLKSYENFIEEKLKNDLKELETALTKKSDDFKLWQELKNSLVHLKEAKDDELNVTFEMGLGVFIGARVEEREKVIVNIGCDCYLEMYYDEAIKYADIRMKYLTKEIEFFRQQAVHVKAHIKLVLLAMNELKE